MSMIEKAARALAEQAIREARRWDTEPSDLERMLPGSIEFCWRDYLEPARAVLLAIREPSEEMTDAGADKLFASYNDVWQDDAKIIWRAMIDTAIA